MLYKKYFKKANIKQKLIYKIKWLWKILNYPFKKLEELMQEEKMNIYEKLLKAQVELKAPKGQYNSFGKYKYRSCEDILEALKPVLDKFKLTLFISDEIVETGGSYKLEKKDETIETAGRKYVKATITLVNIENPDEQIKTSALAREEETKKEWTAHK